MKRKALLFAAVVLSTAGCGAMSSKPANSGPSQQQLDREDTAAIEKEVNQQVQDKMQTAAAERGSTVDASTSCVKQSDTAYKCLTTFTSPPNTPDLVTNVTCNRGGGSCITETKP